MNYLCCLRIVFNLFFSYRLIKIGPPPGYWTVEFAHVAHVYDTEPVCCAARSSTLGACDFSKNTGFSGVGTRPDRNERKAKSTHTHSIVLGGQPACVLRVRILPQRGLDRGGTRHRMIFTIISRKIRVEFGFIRYWLWSIRTPVKYNTIHDVESRLVSNHPEPVRIIDLAGKKTLPPTRLSPWQYVGGGGRCTR